jgi:hypothetical protein
MSIESAASAFSAAILARASARPFCWSARTAARIVSALADLRRRLRPGVSDGFRAAHHWPALQEPFAISSLTRRLTSARRPTDSCQP